MRQDFVMSAGLPTVSGLGAHAVEKKELHRTRE